MGAAFFGLFFSPQARQQIADWFLDGRISFLWIGVLITVLALVFAICFGMMQRGGYIRFKGRGFSLDEALVRSALLEFWSEELPEESIPTEIYCSKGKIEIITEDLKEDLDEIEGRLGFFLAKNLGYERDFFITLSRH